ncbi:MAG: alpha-ketoglutarate-dependent dioxygenase AlkB [Legionella sp.]|nr:alpha-ketoglutarate-dependent dioxygenase AlkB [Legionella sp.]
MATAQWPTGLQYHSDFLSSSQEKDLIALLEGLPWEKVCLFGQVAKRRVVHFGLHYEYNKRTVQPTIPAPDFLKDLITRGAELVHQPLDVIAEILITEYTQHAGINWHRDATVFKEIIGISLGSASVIYFRKRCDHKEQIKLMLEPGSVYVLKDAVRWDWEHRIPPVKTPRYSITLRTLT